MALFWQYVVFLCHHSLLMLIVSHAFLFFFMQKSVSVYVRFDFTFFLLFFCVGTWLFSTSWLLLSYAPLTPRQFPEINEKKQKKQKTTVVPKTWRVMHCGVAASQSQRPAENDSDRQKPSTARMIRPIALAHPFSITSMSSFIVLKVVSFPFKWSPERRAAHCCHLPIDRYANVCPLLTDATRDGG